MGGGDNRAERKNANDELGKVLAHGSWNPVEHILTKR